jgi:hypothetical protein
MPPGEFAVKSATLCAVFRRDYIQRMVQQLAEALARIAGLRAQKDLDGAEREVAEAYRTLNVDPTFLSLDARSLIAVVGDPDRLRMLARLLDEEAAVCEARGDAASARRKRALAAELSSGARGPSAAT